MAGRGAVAVTMLLAGIPLGIAGAFLPAWVVGFSKAPTLHHYVGQWQVADGRHAAALFGWGAGLLLLSLPLAILSEVTFRLIMFIVRNFMFSGRSDGLGDNAPFIFMFTGGPVCIALLPVVVAPTVSIALGVAGILHSIGAAFRLVF